MNDEPMDGYWKAKRSIAFMDLSRGGFYRLVAQGKIPSYRLLGQKTLRFRRCDLEKLLKPNEVNNAS